MSESLSDFYTAADGLTVDAVYSVGSATVPVHFESGYEAAQLGSIAGIEGARYTALAELSRIPAAAHGQTLTIAGTVYTIRGVQADGHGSVLLVLAAP